MWAYSKCPQETAVESIPVEIRDGSQIIPTRFLPLSLPPSLSPFLPLSLSLSCSLSLVLSLLHSIVLALILTCGIRG